MTRTEVAAAVAGPIYVAKLAKVSLGDSKWDLHKAVLEESFLLAESIIAFGGTTGLSAQDIPEYLIPKGLKGKTY